MAFDVALQAALTTFEDLQKWQGPEGERLGEPDDPKCSLPFCNALESAVVAVEQCKGNCSFCSEGFVLTFD